MMFNILLGDKRMLYSAGLECKRGKGKFHLFRCNFLFGFLNIVVIFIYVC